MKKSFLAIVLISFVIAACSTVQSIVRSAFPYTATLQIPSTSKVGAVLSTSSLASTLDQAITGQGSNTNAVKDVRIASAKVEASIPATQNLGVFKAMRIFVSRSDSAEEIMVASREDIGTTIGRSIMLDIDNSKALDDIIRGSSGVRVRLEYVVRNQLQSDVSVKASLSFSVTPNTTR